VKNREPVSAWALSHGTTESATKPAEAHKKNSRRHVEFELPGLLSGPLSLSLSSSLSPVADSVSCAKRSRACRIGSPPWSWDSADHAPIVGTSSAESQVHGGRKMSPRIVASRCFFSRQIKTSSHLVQYSTSNYQRFTFTFTLICHLGKTHGHRSRGDTTWEAQRAARTHRLTNAAHPKDKRRNTEKGGRECQGGRRRQAGQPSSRSRTLPARMYRGWAAALTPWSLSVWLSRGPPCEEAGLIGR
jgi:hypothetical protein